MDLAVSPCFLGQAFCPGIVPVFSKSKSLCPVGDHRPGLRNCPQVSLPSRYRLEGQPLRAHIALDRHARGNYFDGMNEIIQEIFKKYGEYPSSQFPHIEWLKGRMLDIDEEIEDIQQDRNRLLSELCKTRNTINRLRAGLE
jgi:hypothetical protein